MSWRKSAVILIPCHGTLKRTDIFIDVDDATGDSDDDDAVDGSAW